MEKIAAFTKMRDAEDSERYKKLYNIDNEDYAHVDLVIDTERYTPEQIVSLILEGLAQKKLIERSSGSADD